MSETSVKQDTGKRRLDLLPWDALDEVGNVLTYGVNKYPNPEQNWRVNSTKDDIKRYKAALLRHFSRIEQGELYDEESGCLHSACIATNALFIIALEKKFLLPTAGNKQSDTLKDNYSFTGPGIGGIPLGNCKKREEEASEKN